MRFKSSVTVKYLADFKIPHLKIWKVGKLSKANSWEEAIFVWFSQYAVGERTVWDIGAVMCN